MGIVATPLVPSSSNTQGTAFGTVVGGAASVWLAGAPFVAKLALTPFAVALGLTPLGIAALGGTLAASLAGYAYTHYKEVQSIGNVAIFLSNIKTENSFPTGKNGSGTAPSQNVGMAAASSQGASNGNYNRRG